MIFPLIIAAFSGIYALPTDTPYVRDAPNGLLAGQTLAPVPETDIDWTGSNTSEDAPVGQPVLLQVRAASAESEAAAE